MTPGTAFLKRTGIAFTEHDYEYVEHGGTEVSAQSLGVPEHQVVKTLVMQDEEGRPLIVLMHGDRKVSTKNLARQAGRKRIEPCKPEVAQRHSGYQVGGTSPFGTRKPLPVFIERSILELDRIYINGGRRGLLVKLRSADLARALEPRSWSTSLYRDADELGVGEDAELGGAHLHPRRAEIVDQQRRDAVGEGLDQAEVLAGRQRADAQRHLLVVDGVGHLVALEHRACRAGRSRGRSRASA